MRTVEVVDEPGAFSLLDAFQASGFNCVDTSDSYSTWVPGNRGGESETIIGKWMKLRGNRSKMVIATKVGSEMGPGMKGLSKSYILRAAEDSLEAYALLVKEGKVRAIGASNLTPARLSASLEASDRSGYPRYQSMQPHYNLCERSAFEKELEPLCRDQKLAVIPYYPLASGFLTGKYRSEHDLSKSVRGADVRKYFNQRGFRILAALDAVAARQKATPASVALAWLLARPGITAPIVSATSPRQWEELAAAPGVRLDSSSRELLNRASA